MLTATIHLDLDRDFVLSDLNSVCNGPFSVPFYKVVDRSYVKFVINAGEHRDACAAILRKSDAVKTIEYASNSQLLVTKRSSGALPIIRENNGILYNMSQFDGTRRVFDIIISERDDLKAIINDLRTLGSIRLERLESFAASSSSSLSSRQSEVIKHAYEAGYFDWPRRADAETLADQLDISHSTFLEHLRKAEKKVIGKALSGATLTEQTSLESDQ